MQKNRLSRKEKKGNKETSAWQYFCYIVLVIAAIFLIQYSIAAYPPLSQANRNVLNSPVSKVTVSSHEAKAMLPPEMSVKKRRKIAYAITITKDGFFQDGAAVLAYSVIAASKGKDYDISFIAFVHPDVTAARPFLRKLGYNVIEAPTPLNTSAITGNKFLREKIDKNGCCGATELIKLYAYRMTQFDRVIHMDADTIVINPFDELFDTEYSLAYTTDPNMATFKGELGLPVQGGFLVLRPSLADYKAIVNIVMTVPFRNGGGWNNSHIGWYWGGMTIQGVLAYYYYLVTPGRHLKLDRCIYNTMADTIHCSTQTLSEIKTAHFTVCQKPWICDTWRGDFHENLCVKLQERWFELRQKAEEFYGIPVVPKACKKRGKKHYIPMQLENARIPVDSGITPFNAPVKLDPLPGAGFTKIDKKL